MSALLAKCLAQSKHPASMLFTKHRPHKQETLPPTAVSSPSPQTLKPQLNSHVGESQGQDCLVPLKGFRV